MNENEITLEEIMTSGKTAGEIETMLSKYIKAKHYEEERKLFEKINLEQCTIPELIVINTTQNLKFTPHKQSYVDTQLSKMTSLKISEPVKDYCLSVLSHLEIENDIEGQEEHV